jgi:hypothetical protein
METQKILSADGLFSKLFSWYMNHGLAAKGLVILAVSMMLVWIFYRIIKYFRGRADEAYSLPVKSKRKKDHKDGI